MDPITLGILGLGAYFLFRSGSKGESTMSGSKVDSFWYDVYGAGSFHFTIMKQSDGEYRIYIDQQPPYPSGRATGGHETHRYGLGSGSPFICYEPPPRTLKDARTVAESWARHTVRYMRTGRW